MARRIDIPKKVHVCPLKKFTTLILVQGHLLEKKQNHFLGHDQFLMYSSFCGFTGALGCAHTHFKHTRHELPKYDFI